MFKNRVLALLLVMMLAFSMFAATAVAVNAEGDDAGYSEDPNPYNDPEEDPNPYNDPEEDPAADDAIAAVGAASDETEPATEAQTEAETIAETEAETEAETIAETVAPTVAPSNADTPKTGDDMWLYIGIGVVAAAVIALIIVGVAKKKAK